MPAAKKTSVPEARLRLYHKVIEAVHGVEAKSNFGSAYTAVNGNMYSMISKYGVVGIRLPEGDREAFIAKHKTTIYRADPKWPPNKEMVAVPGPLLDDTKALTPYLERSYRYALTLRPKGTTGGKKEPAKATKKTAKKRK